jgi:alkanesulfonate monooxygenase SsuD/methylene tetrahydromethanopterin reductase-like flavin-dependent oxidoreductase (luciferase family)
MSTIGKVRGFLPPPRPHFDHEANGGGALFVGGPEEIAERIVNLQKRMGHVRQFFQMDIGQLPQKDFLRGIELLGTKVKPLVNRELATTVPKELADA